VEWNVKLNPDEILNGNVQFEGESMDIALNIPLEETVFIPDEQSKAAKIDFPPPQIPDPPQTPDPPPAPENEDSEDDPRPPAPPR
jgi:hypothetical protein